MAAGVFGYLGYDMVRLMEELPPPNPDPIGIPDAMLIRPTIIVVFDAVKDAITVVTPVRPEPGVAAKAALARAAERLSGDRRRARPAARQVAGRMSTPARSTCRRRPTPRRPSTARWCCEAKEYIAAGDIFQVVLSQRFEAPFTLPPFSLYRALRRVNPVAVPLFPRLRRLRDRRLEPGNPGARARRHGHHPPDRRHAPARRDAARGQGAGRRTARRSQGARRASDAARSRPQRCRPRRRDRHGQGHRPVLHRALQPGHAHRLQCRGQARPRPRRDRCAGRRLSRRHRVRRAEGARHGDHRRTGEGKARRSMPAASAISPPPARWTPASCCAPRSSRTARCMCRPAPASSPTAIPTSEQQECVNKAKALFRAAEEARRFASAAGRGQ